VELLSFQDGKKGFSCGIGGFSVIVGFLSLGSNERSSKKVLVYKQSNSVSRAVMSGIIKFFLHFIQMVVSFFSCFYREECSEKSTSFDFRNFVAERLGDGGVGEFLHCIFSMENLMGFKWKEGTLSKLKFYL
jgi:hypothetical protein